MARAREYSSDDAVPCVSVCGCFDIRGVFSGSRRCSFWCFFGVGVLTYRDALTEAMNELARDVRVVFLGQGVRDPGTFMSTTLQGVPLEKRIELPVMEEAQLGMSIGMALDGLVPVSIYPRWNFLLLATNQLVNHLDKFGAHVIVRVGIGSTKPLHPGPQHVGNFANAFRQMMPNTHIMEIEHATAVGPVYRRALEHTGPSIIVEEADRYENQAS